MKASALRVVIGGLAATRLIRAWKFEKIGEAPYDKLVGWLKQPVLRNGSVAVRPTVVKEWLSDLVECPHCLGAWVSIGCVIGLRNRWSRPVIEGLASATILSAFVQWYPGFDFEPVDDAASD